MQRKNNVCTIKGKVCPEHKLKNKPYELILIINERQEKILKLKCQDCAASEGIILVKIYFKDLLPYHL